MFRKIQEARENEEGFTLIELLVVVIIIGILAAIAIPVFLNQRESAWVSAAESDARNGAIEVETYFTQENAYPASFTNATGGVDLNEDGSDDITLSTGVVMDLDTSAGSSYLIYTCHEQLEGAGCSPTTNPTATYDSSAGGLQ